MKNRVLVIKMNLLPWYNELTDELDIGHPGFPAGARERIQSLGEYSIVAISKFETRLRQDRQEENLQNP
ncbi:hypothetical protein ACFPES_13380 [Paenibacillus sp. GCM10023248]|uniref:hypothetical protein n=1 Tax=Bacillales TaxID=1385 RepID=UPI00237807A9|nr:MULTISPECIES: hypothetical protein [Bacillales]MDD9268024.1 hypothetical protein [Paenibacillus sp. MAHUQ-63]MDR6879697.1 hypothetical protein [Bacillus sp. 3255]